MKRLHLPLRVPRRLARRFLERFRRTTSAEFSAGNQVTFLGSGEQFFSDLFTAIDGAVSTISLEYYIVRADRTGEALARRLQQAVSRGVKVRLLYDYVGSFETPSEFFARLTILGVHTAPFNPPPFSRRLSWFDRRDHRKLAVIDNSVAYIGGLNIGDMYAGVDPECCWHDLGLRLEGPAVKELQELFSETWMEATAEEILPGLRPAAVGNSNVAIVSGGPHHNRSRISAAFLLGMAGAGVSIRIETPYFIPGPRFVRAMLRAVRRGAEVEIILPQQCDVPFVKLINRCSYSTLIRGGVKVYERTGAILHAKVMVIDGSWGVIGSANLDHRSFHRNYEVNIIVLSDEFGAQLEEFFVAERDKSELIKLERHEKRGVFLRVLEWAIQPVNWFL